MELSNLIKKKTKSDRRKELELEIKTKLKSIELINADNARSNSLSVFKLFENHANLIDFPGVVFDDQSASTADTNSSTKKPDLE